MTARQQIRVGRRLRGERAPIDATGAPSVGDLLHAAREKKGVDLYRAERDTKIRARHLSALEDGDYAELPGAVYTKGFLRNYALYLGLDPVGDPGPLARRAGPRAAIVERRHGRAAPAADRPAPGLHLHAQPRGRRGPGTGGGPVRGLRRDAALPVLAGPGAEPRRAVDHPGRPGPDERRADRQQPGARHGARRSTRPGTMVRSTDSDDDGHWSLVAAGPEGQQRVHAHRARPRDRPRVTQPTGHHRGRGAGIPDTHPDTRADRPGGPPGGSADPSGRRPSIAPSTWSSPVRPPSRSRRPGTARGATTRR